jgi:hypothetical protein
VPPKKKRRRRRVVGTLVGSFLHNAIVILIIHPSQQDHNSHNNDDNYHQQTLSMFLYDAMTAFTIMLVVWSYRRSRLARFSRRGKIISCDIVVSASKPTTTMRVPKTNTDSCTRVNRIKISRGNNDHCRLCSLPRRSYNNDKRIANWKEVA